MRSPCTQYSMRFFSSRFSDSIYIKEVSDWAALLATSPMSKYEDSGIADTKFTEAQDHSQGEKSNEVVITHIQPVVEPPDGGTQAWLTLMGA